MLLGLGADLPSELISVLPQDPLGQLEVANKIVAFAYSQKVAAVEAEAQQLREAVISKQNMIKSLERRVSQLEGEVGDWQAKARTAAEENHRLTTEKGALIDTVKRLNREVAKLEGFKRSLIQHLQDDDEPGTQLDRTFAAVDLSSDRLVADVLNTATKGGVSSSGRGGPSPTPYGGGVPPAPSSTGRAFSTSPPRGASGPPSSSSPTTGTGYGAGSAYGSSPRIDGKEFFKQARARLPYEAFSSFLATIKDLNAGRTSRDDTLRRAQALFGPQHADLYALFESLLSKNNAF